MRVPLQEADGDPDEEDDDEEEENVLAATGTSFLDRELLALVSIVPSASMCFAQFAVRALLLVWVWAADKEKSSLTPGTLKPQG